MTGAEFIDIIVSLSVLTLLEIVLGIDNLVFVAISSSRLPPAQQKPARRMGLMLAWVTRLILLASALWLSKLTTPWFTVFGHEVSGRDLFLCLGGLFLLAKSVQEIHLELEPEDESGLNKTFASFAMVITQIAILDIIFSLDSVLTAIGLTQRYWIMATAITIAILVMIFASEPLAKFIEKHPTVKMLALSFLILIGMVLIADSLHYHLPRGYIYFSISFSLLVESLNWLRSRKRKSE